MICHSPNTYYDALFLLNSEMIDSGKFLRRMHNAWNAIMLTSTPILSSDGHSSIECFSSIGVNPFLESVHRRDHLYSC